MEPKVLSIASRSACRSAEQLNANLQHFEVSAMSVVDVVIGKLARFTPFVRFQRSS
jgi:hypothetical protein